MALTFSLPASHSFKNAGLEVWMDRVLERAEQVSDRWDVDGVHDLRVALRRCRTIADALSEVNPGPGWRKLKRASRELFHELGNLRDAQVLRSRVKKLGPAGDPVRKRMLQMLSRAEKKHHESAEKALDDFDRKEWKKLTRKLISKSRFFPVNSVVYQRLSLTRLNEVVETYQQARRRPSSVAWHRLRIGLKNFRYLVENFLPQRYENWSDDLKRMQDLLGDVHDLDVLRQQVRRNSAKLNPALVAEWIERIDRERKAHLQEFLARTTGPESPWFTWRAGFQWGHVLVASSTGERRRTA
jgi:CHAD domain-containing protein